ncbi:hypothetical protein Tco_0757672 [Tanacetum coccineum]
MQIFKLIFKGWFEYIGCCGSLIAIIEMCIDTLIEVDGAVDDIVVSEQDEFPSSDDGRMYSGHLEAKVEVTKLSTGRLVNGSSYDGIDMVIKDLDLEPKIDAMMRDFLEMSKNPEVKISHVENDPVEGVSSQLQDMIA